jgi:NADH-quinone oxidoreductase subunit E
VGAWAEIFRKKSEEEFLRILLIIQGDYGRRYLEAMTQYAPAGWEINYYVFPEKLAIGIDDSLEDFLPSSLPGCDLLLMLQEDPVVAEMAPHLAKITGASAVIAPIDNKAFLPSGLARQIRKKLAEREIALVHPLVFCALTEEDSASPHIRAFARYFGRPKVEITLDKDKVAAVKVLRDAPCGNTRYVAKNLVGVHVKDAMEQAGLLHHAYPCVATMTHDDEIGDTLMHQAGLMTKTAVEEALKENLNAGLKNVLCHYKGHCRELVPILQDTQGMLGYLPEAAMREIACFLGLPESHVYGVATFYDQFYFIRRGRNQIKVCCGTACHVKGAIRVLEEFERQLGIDHGETTSDYEYSLDRVACVGACALAPVVVVGKKVYGEVTPGKARSVLG